MCKRLKYIIISIFVIFQVSIVNTALGDDLLEDEPARYIFSNNSVKVSGVPVIDATAAIVMDMKSGRVLYSRNPTARRSIASTTKIMTAIVAIENGRLDDIVTVSKRAARVGGSTINLQAGQKFTLNELLYGLLLNSGNDAAIAVAEHIGGTVEDFADMMNKKAVKLGAVNTSYVTPHGLDAEGHYSTAYDLAIITRYALNNPIFSKIVATNITSIPGRQLYNTNEMLEIYPGADGVKTGYTGKAGRCLVTSATRDGMRLISVVLGCPTRYKRAEGTKAILDYSFNNFKLRTLVEVGQEYGNIPVDKGTGNVSIKAAEIIQIPMKDDELERLQVKAVIPGKLTAPVYAGADAGYVEFMVDDEIIAQTTLKTWQNVRRKVFMDYFGSIIDIWGRMMREGIFNTP
jgi:serine-type D-Ala-D-Ala carboxypeptidase (penicillin-binding protein 5/6)